MSKIKLNTEINQETFDFKLGKVEIQAKFKSMNPESYVNIMYKMATAKAGLETDCLIMDELFIGFDKEILIDKKPIEKFSEVLKSNDIIFGSLFQAVRGWVISDMNRLTELKKK